MCGKYMGAMRGAQNKHSRGRAKTSRRRAKNSRRRERSTSRSRGGGYAFDLNNQVACGRPAVVWQNDYFYDTPGATIGGTRKKKKITHKGGKSIRRRGGNLDDRDFSCKQPVWGPQCLG
ncbi:g648 [Coccomyxa elongata]